LEPWIATPARLAGRAWRLTFRPAQEWRALSEAPASTAGLFAYLLPLALVPALAWSLGRHGTSTELRWQLPLLLLFLCVASIALLAAAYWLVMPLYGRPRNWRGTFAVAVCSATPVLLAGALLVGPQLLLVAFIAAVHSLVLQHMGVQAVLGVKRGDAAEAVAIAGVLMVAASMVCGALLARVGVVPI
jgi:hypothetical protein